MVNSKPIPCAGVISGTTSKPRVISELNGPCRFETIGGAPWCARTKQRYTGVTTISAGALGLGSGVVTGVSAVSQTRYLELRRVPSGARAFMQIGPSVTRARRQQKLEGATTASAGTLMVSRGPIDQFGRDRQGGAMLAGTGTVSATMINAGGISRRARPIPPGTMTVGGTPGPIAAASAWMLCSPFERDINGRTRRSARVYTTNAVGHSDCQA
jgi:hypothetical protein